VDLRKFKDTVRNFDSDSLVGSDLTGHMVMMTCRFPFIPTDLKSPVGLFVSVELSISSWYLDSLKTPDIGKISQVRFHL
jgi:hypothetical protein